MKILIVEDEPLAAAQLAVNIAALKPGAQIVAVCDTVKSTVNWLQNNPAPDLSFFDIQLGDGLSFEIFEKVDFRQPVIFITAFNQYAIQAFKVNSIDYLLKPIDRNDLERALKKYETILQPKNSVISVKAIEEIISSLNSRLKLKVQNPIDDEFLVAREKVKDFKEWLEGKN